MADNKIVLETKIETAESAKTLGELRKSLKELINEQENVTRGSKEWKKLANAINETEGKIGDLTDSFNTLRGSGVERTKASLGLFKEGFESFDFGKIKLGLQGLGAAFKAIPIFLIIEGVMKLYENFDKLKASGGLLGKIFRGIGEAIEWVTDKIGKFTDWIGITDNKHEKMAQDMIDRSKSMKEAVEDRYNTEIALAGAAGKNTLKLEEQKAVAVQKGIEAQIKSLKYLEVVQGELNDSQKKQLADLEKEKAKARLDEGVARQKQYKELVEAIKKEQEERAKAAKEAADKRKEAEKKRLEDSQKESDALFEQLSKNQDVETKAEQERRKAEKELREKNAQEYADYLKRQHDREIAAYDEKEKKKEELFKKRLETEQAYTNTYLNASKALSEAFFAFQFNSAKGNAARELELKKKQFQVNKAFTAAQAIQDGIAATLKAFKDGGGFPAGLALSIPTGIIAAANVAKILATKFDGGGGSSGDSSFSGGGGGMPSLPQPSTTTAPNIQPTTKLDEQGNVVKEPKIWVSVSEINETQGRVSKLSEQAKF